ncbi:MAG: hypothetical protein HY047_18565 [Acidobacteria bacterium]|nr:hypothetical protein [Acidobacteriota bacterium]
MRVRRVALLVAGASVHWACGSPRAASPPVASAAVSSAAPGDGATMPHGDHNPRFGGVVLMNGDLHFEVILRRDGRYQVYFSDAGRNELPASFASSVSIAVTPKSGAAQTVTLQIDDMGESWIGSGQSVTEPDAVARVTYSIHGKPYWIDLPFSTMPAPGR